MFLLFALQAEISNALAHLSALQELDDVLPNEQGDDQRQQYSEHGPEGDELQQSTPREFYALIRKPVEQLVEHGLYLSNGSPGRPYFYFSSILNISSNT